MSRYSRIGQIVCQRASSNSVHSIKKNVPTKSENLKAKIAVGIGFGATTFLVGNLFLPVFAAMLAALAVGTLFYQSAELG